MQLVARGVGSVSLACVYAGILFLAFRSAADLLWGVLYTAFVYFILVPLELVALVAHWLTGISLWPL